MTREEYDRCMKHWEATRTDGRPLIPYSMQVEVCEYWRTQAALDADRSRREIQAAHLQPAPLTAWRGRPWEDVQ